MLQLDLSGKTALVTGSTAGIGLAIVRRLAQCGARVIVNGRGQERTDRALAELRAEDPKADLVGFAGDLGTAEGVDRIIAAHPHVDILVNNLGIFALSPFQETSDAEWSRFFEINVMSGVRLTRHYLPGMVAAKWGRVVFISSESGLNIPGDMIHYGFTKAAQIAIARGIAETVPGTGVTVNSVLPGPTLSEGVTAMMQKMSDETGQSMEEVEQGFIRNNRPTSLIQRMAQPEEVANMVAYVCSPLASATSGAALRVEGGLLRHPG